MKTRLHFVQRLILLGMILCAGMNFSLQAEEVKPSPSNPEDSYLLQPGDRLSIRVYPEDEYIKVGETEISSEGNITIPHVGKINVAGKNTIEAERAVVDILSKDYLVDPEVVIEVLAYKKQSFSIIGQVRKPGIYEFPAGQSRFTLLQAVALAGGFSDVANTKKIKVIRKSGDKSDIIHANAESIISGNDPDVELEAGDNVHVTESLF